MTTKSKSRLKVFALDANYTPLPNAIADHIYPALGTTTAAVLGVIIRQTIGWHRQTGDVSYEAIKNATGIKNRNSISSSLKLLLKVGLITATKEKGKTTEYAIAAGLEVESIDELLERIRTALPARNTSNKTILVNAATSDETILVPVSNQDWSPTTLPIEEKQETQVGGAAPVLSPEVVARARRRPKPQQGFKDPLASSLENRPLRKIMAVAKRGPYADAAAALVAKYFEVTHQPMDTAAIERSMHPARRLAGIGATDKLVESAWEESKEGKAFAVTSLFSLEGTIRRLMGESQAEETKTETPAPQMERRWNEKRKTFEMVSK